MSEAIQGSDALAELRASERRFRALVQNSFDVMFLVDADGTIRYASPTTTRVLGYEPAELTDRRAREFIHPGDLQLTREDLSWLTANPGESVRTQVRVRHANGTWRWVEAVHTNLLHDEAVRAVITNLRDVTERTRTEHALRESEERFKSLVEHAPGVVEILDREGNLRWVGPSVVDIFGYDPETMVGTAAGSYCHPDDLPSATAAFDSVLDESGATAGLEVRVRHADGTWCWVELLFTNRLEDPSIEGMVANLRDITESKEVEGQLAESEALFRSLAESSPVGIFTIDERASMVWVNERWLEITGLTFEEGIGSRWQELIHPDDRHLLGLDDEEDEEKEEEAQVVTVPDRFSATFRVTRPEDGTRWVNMQLSPVEDPDSRVAAVGTLQDITERVLAEQDTQRLIDIFEATHDLVGMADREGNLLYFNRAARRFFGLPDHGDLDGFNLADTFPPWILDRLTGEVQPALERDGIWSGEITIVSPDGRPVPVLAQLLVHRDAENNFEYFSGVMRDISDRKRIEEQLAHQATHDPLTGLPNRVLLLEKLEHAIERAHRQRRSVAVLFLDLDHFKVVNDSLGHGLGDRLLVAIADRLTQAVRPGDTIARFGGDEFVVLCEGIEQEEDAIAIARRVDTAISGSFHIDDLEIYVGLSIGIALSVETTSDPETLIRDADAAMYRAKDKGRARYEVFNSAMRESAVDRLDIENALRRSLERHELRVYYQPIVDLGSGRIAGVEALVRWDHPERGLLLPGEFIAVAEETGLIVPIGRYVLALACRQAERWHVSVPEHEGLFVAVNLSGRQLSHPDLVEDVESILAETGLDPALVELEITESVLMDDVELSDQTLGRLRNLGVKLVVDDFGTGYSSLSYLRRFPVDVLKVDRSFVAGLGREQGDSAIVEAIVTLAHTLGLRAVAEGVEEAAQLEEVRAMGCDLAQGFHLGRPLDSDALVELLSSDPRF